MFSSTTMTNQGDVIAGCGIEWTDGK